MSTIEKRGETYRITVSAGYDLNGKQIKHKMTYKPAPGMTKKQIEKELHRQAVLFEEKTRTGAYIESNIKFADFAERWFKDYAEKHLKPKTVAHYRALLPRINDGIGNIRLDRLQPVHIIKLFDELEKDGIRADAKYSCKLDLKELLKQRGITKKRLAELAKISVSTVDSLTNGKNISQSSANKIAAALQIKPKELFNEISKGKLSEKTLRLYFVFLSSVLSTAVEWQIILYNPCDRVKSPRTAKKEPEILDDKQALELLEKLHSEDTQHRTAIIIALFLGLRRGEILGLKWENIDFDNGIITIKNNLQYLPGKGIYNSSTKTSSSERAMKAPELVMLSLKEQRKYQLETKIKAGDRWIESGYVFTKPDGTPCHPDSLTKWFKQFIRDNGFPENIKLHSLRHTCASLMISEGIPITTVARRLGHSTAATTTSIYAHAIQSADEAAAQRIENILNPNIKQNERNA